MRQLTEAEELAMRQSRLLHIKSSGTRQVDISQVEAAKFGFRFGFIAGLDHAQAKIEVLEAIIKNALNEAYQNEVLDTQMERSLVGMPNGQYADKQDWLDSKVEEWK